MTALMASHSQQRGSTTTTTAGFLSCVLALLISPALVRTESSDVPDGYCSESVGCDLGCCGPMFVALHIVNHTLIIVLMLGTETRLVWVW